MSKTVWYMCFTSLEYWLEVWGYTIFKCADNIQERALRFFLLRFNPLASFRGEVGWHKTQCNRWVNMYQIWNRLFRMSDSRITINIFERDLSQVDNYSNWLSELTAILSDILHSDWHSAFFLTFCILSDILHSDWHSAFWLTFWILTDIRYFKNENVQNKCLINRKSRFIKNMSYERIVSLKKNLLMNLILHPSCQNVNGQLLHS